MSKGQDEVAEIYAEIISGLWEKIKKILEERKKDLDLPKEDFKQIIEEFKKENPELFKQLKESEVSIDKDFIKEQIQKNVRDYVSKFEKSTSKQFDMINDIKKDLDPSSEKDNNLLEKLNEIEDNVLDKVKDKNEILEPIIKNAKENNVDLIEFRDKVHDEHEAKDLLNYYFDKLEDKDKYNLVSTTYNEETNEVAMSLDSKEENSNSGKYITLNLATGQGKEEHKQGTEKELDEKDKLPKKDFNIHQLRREMNNEERYNSIKRDSNFVEKDGQWQKVESFKKESFKTNIKSNDKQENTSNKQTVTIEDVEVKEKEKVNEKENSREEFEHEL